MSPAESRAVGQASVVGLAVVGSYAHGRPRMASDVDLLVMTPMPGIYVGGRVWIEQLFPGARLIRTST